MTEHLEFKEAMARMAAAVCVITTDGRSGPYGLTATAVCSVSANPPMLLVCINRESKASAVVQENGRFRVNILAAHQKALSETFSRSGLSVEERFAQSCEWRTQDNESPMLPNAVATVDCLVSFSISVDSHSIFFGRVRDVTLANTKSSLCYFDRSYHQLASTRDSAAIE